MDAQHQNVTRIASAPNSSLRLWSKSQNILPNTHDSISFNRLGSSQTELHLPPSFECDKSAIKSYKLSKKLSQSKGQESNIQKIYAPIENDTKIRQHLHYHLASIFPEDQVRAAMSLHPCETDPQRICATILAMFPNV